MRYDPGENSVESGRSLNQVGVFQGRLSPPIDNRIQAFPGARWQQEFEIASKLGLSSIEWILESPLEENPLWTDDGVLEMADVVRRTGVSIDFICVDFFLESPFVRMSPTVRETNQSVLKHALEQAARLNIIGIEIPMVDASRINALREEDELAKALEPGLETAFKRNIQIGLETSLNPDRFRNLLETIDHPALRANYDSGNSASLGYDPAEEFDAYSKWINNVHLKDRVLGGGTVPFGKGNTDIPKVLKLLRDHNYSGDFVLQGARQGSPRQTVQHYFEQVTHWLAEAAG